MLYSQSHLSTDLQRTTLRAPQVEGYPKFQSNKLTELSEKDKNWAPGYFAAIETIMRAIGAGLL